MNLKLIQKILGDLDVEKIEGVKALSVTLNQECHLLFWNGEGCIGTIYQEYILH